MNKEVFPISIKNSKGEQRCLDAMEYNSNDSQDRFEGYSSP